MNDCCTVVLVIFQHVILHQSSTAKLLLPLLLLDITNIISVSMAQPEQLFHSYYYLIKIKALI